MVIETNRLILRKYSLKDINDIFGIFSDKITMSFWDKPFTREMTTDWIKKSIQFYRKPGFGRLGVILKEKNILIGDCGIIESSIDNRFENDLGYIFHRKYWGMGYATEAAQGMKNFALDKLNLNRLCANMPFNHTASVRVAEKIGMVKEKEFYNKKNRYILTYLFAIEKK